VSGLSSLFADPSAAGALSLLTTSLLLGIRHGIDWDHVAAITDITSTTAAGGAGEQSHAQVHARPGAHDHEHGGSGELRTHAGDPGGSTSSPTTVAAAAPSSVAAPVALAEAAVPPSRARLRTEQRRAVLLGTLYALGHALVVAILGILALLFGALLPDWIDPIMGRIVGITLIVLGVWVFYSVYAYVRHGSEFRLRSRWMLVFDSVRYAWRWFQARLHGHEHVEPVEMSSYGPRTAFGVGMIHGIGAETGSQALIIAAVGGAATLGLGVPMVLAFIIGLLISNTAIVLLTATGFVASQLRERIYLVVGILAGAFSLVVGTLFLFQAEGSLPDLNELLRPFIGAS
jgi:cytochrome c biogenesis protein CcdA